MTLSVKLRRTSLAICFALLVSMSSSPAADKPDPTWLCRSAQNAVKSRLKAPATARFPDCAWDADEYEIRGTPDASKYWVFGHVDSQNGFGALIRSRFGVVFERKKAGEALVVTSVVID